MRRTPSLSSRRVAALALALSACAGDDAPALEDAASPDPMRAEAAGSKTLSSSAKQALRDAEGTFFAAVRAEGTGCPEGTLNTRVSADGQAFTTTFTSFELRIDPSSAAMTLNCRFAVLLDAPGGRTFCVKQFGYSGYAFLQAGVAGRQVADYYFNEQKLDTESAQRELAGPHDGEYVFIDTVRPEEEIWSPCGERRELYIDTKLELVNGSPRAAGFINLSAADGQNTVEFQLASHRCDAARDDGFTVGPFGARSDKLTNLSAATAPDEGGGTEKERGWSPPARSGQPGRAVGSIGRTAR